MKTLTIITFILPLIIWTTNKAQENLPYNTGFETATDRSDWQTHTLGHQGNYTWNYSGNTPHSGNYKLWHDYEVGGSANDTIDDWKVSPAINFSNGGQLSLKVNNNTAFSPPQESDYFGIWYSTSSSDPLSGTFYEIADLTNKLTSSDFQTYKDTSISITTPANSGYVAFRYKTTNNWFNIAIDEIEITSGTVNIKEDFNAFELYPNPTQDVLNISFIPNNPIINPVKISLQSIDGKIVEKLSSSTTQKVTLDLSKHKKGVYILIVNEVYSEKVIIH